MADLLKQAADIEPRVYFSKRGFSPKSQTNECPQCGGQKICKSRICRNCRNQNAHPPERHESFLVEGDMCRWLPLSQGLYAIVDADMYPHLSQFLWHITKNTRSPLYAETYDSNDDAQKLHWLVAKRKLVDHINGNGLDNRRRNLRPYKLSRENSRNRKMDRRNTSGYKGICLDKRRGRWNATITVNRKSIYLGSYLNPHDAARAYDAAARIYFGEFARVNFPNLSIGEQPAREM